MCSQAGFQTAVWQKLFELCLAMLTVDALKIEKFSDSKKEFILKRYGDIRQFVIEQVRECWKVSQSALGCCNCRAHRTRSHLLSGR